MQMSIDELFALYGEIENEFPVDNWRVNGIAVWPVIRLRMGMNANTPNVSFKKTKSYRWINIMKIISKVIVDEVMLSMRGKYAACVPSDILMLGDTCDRNVKLPNGELYNHNLDPLKNVFNNQGISVMNFELIGHASSQLLKKTNSYVVDKADIWTKVTNKIGIKNKGSLKCELDNYEKFLKKISKRGINIAGLTKENIIKIVLYLSNMSAFFERKIKVITPKIVIYTDWYSPVKMALALAAHRLNIPVVEVQHGVAAGNGRHPSYYNWSRIPVGGFAIMPDYMWVWDEDDYKAMEPWAKENLRPFIGGHPMNLIWSDPESVLSSFYQTKYDKEYGHAKPTILMTLQWGEPYAQWIIDFINQHDEFIWLIRLHPVVDKYEKDFIEQLQDKCNIHKNSVGIFPLEILLKNVDIHITLHSSVVLDAEPFACPSIVMHPEAKEMYSKQIAGNLVYYADNAEDLQARMNDLLAQRNRRVANQDIQKQYKVGCDAMKKIMDIIDNSKPCWE